MSLNKRYYDIEGAYGYNGILANTDDRDFLEQFGNQFTLFCRESNIIAEFTRFNPLLKNHLWSRYMTVEAANKNIVVDLTASLEHIWTDYYEHAARKNIKKAQRSGLSVKAFWGKEMDAHWLKEFIKIYYVTMDRNDSEDFYYFKEDYFNGICQNLGEHSLFFFTMLEDKVLSCELVLLNSLSAYSFLGGTLSEYYPLRPNNILKHEIIRYLKTMNVKEYCMGGGSTLDDSLYRYKRTFARQGEVEFYIGKKIYDQETYNTVCQIWADRFPEKAQSYQNYFLKYKRG